MATHSSTLAWKIPQTEEPGRPQSMGLQRIEHDLTTEQQQQNKSFWRHVLSVNLGKCIILKWLHGILGVCTTLKKEY